MAVQGLAVSDFVNVSVSVSPVSVPYSNIGVPLFIGDSNIIDVSARVREYTSLAGIATDFGTTAPEYLAAVPYFDQSPQPAIAFVGRWASSAAAGELEGAFLTATEELLSNFTAVSSGSFFINLDSHAMAITGVNLSGALNLNNVAADVQAALIAAGGNAALTVQWNAAYQQFIITSGVVGPTSSVSYLAPPTAVGKLTATSNPAPAATVTLGGTAVSFVSALTTGNQVLIGGTDLVTMTNLMNFLNSSTDVNISQCNYSLGSTGLVLYVVNKTPGVAGDSFTIASSSGAITASGATLAGATGTDLSGLLGLSLAAGATPPVAGIAAETLLAATTACLNANSGWYDEILSSTATPAMADLINTANFILASPRLNTFGISTSDTGVLNPADTNDVATVMSSLNNKRVFVNYSSTTPYSVGTIAGRIGTVNYLGNDTTITVAWKQAPGIIAEVMNQNQFTTLMAKGANAVITVANGAHMIWPGQMANGYWIDEVFGLDWQANYVQTNVFNFMYSSVTTKVPQTDAGDNSIATVISASLAQGVTNGLLAPGIWLAETLGPVQTNQMLTNGYQVFYPLIATQSQTSRDLRQSVLFQAALKLAGAVHQVFVALNVNR